MRVTRQPIEFGDYELGAVYPARLDSFRELRSVVIALAGLYLGELANNLPIAAVQERIDSLALPFEPEPAPTLPIGSRFSAGRHAKWER
jgi:hypothetical protein